MDVGQRIRELRKSLGIRIVDLAERVGISHPYLSQIERGDRQCPLDTLQKICDELNVSLSDFFKNDSNAISPDVLKLLETIKTLTPIQRTLLEQFLREMSK